MIYFSKYAEQKFDILNKYKVYYTREQIEDTLNEPAKIMKKGNYQSAVKDRIKVVYQTEAGVKKVITFYPIKN